MAKSLILLNLQRLLTIDNNYYKLKAGSSIGTSFLIGKLAEFSIGVLVGAGLSLGVTAVGIIVVVALALLLSYVISKFLEWMDEKYENKKKEWFE